MFFFDNPDSNNYGSDFFCRNEKTLVGVARKHRIRVRWQENDAAFQNAQQRLSAKKKSNELLRLPKMASERTFLLELKNMQVTTQIVTIS